MSRFILAKALGQGRKTRILSAGGDVTAPTYSGATIAPLADDSDNGIAHLAFSEVITSATADYKTGFTLDSRESGGSWTTITSWTGALHGDGDKIIATLTGAVDTWQGGHEFRLSYDSGAGDIKDAAGNALASITNDATVTNNSTFDLLANIAAFWKLGEASGSRADSAGANTLVDNNTVTQAAGKIGNAAQFTSATSEHLSIVDNANLSIGGTDITIAGWMYFDSKTGNNMYVCSKQDAGGGAQGEIHLYYDPIAADMAFAIMDGSSSTNVGNIHETGFGTPANATWYFLVARLDDNGGGSGSIDIQVNDGTPVSTSLTGVPGDSTSSFRVGAINAAPSNFWDGRIDGLGFWRKLLSVAEQTDLYNSGNGKEYPFLPT
jgi:hypothetical protein